MSVVVALKHKGVVYIGADSQVTSDLKNIYSSPVNYKVKKIKGVENGIVGTVGRAIISNMIMTNDSLVSEKDLVDGYITYDFIVNNVVDKLLELQLKCGITKKDDIPYSLKFEALIAHRDKLFLLQSSDGGVVFEIENHCVIGSGTYEASGSLSSTEGQNPIERIQKAIVAAKNYDRNVDFPVIIMNTENDKVIHIKEKISFKHEERNA